MAASDPDNIHAPAVSTVPAAARRVHSYSRLTTAIAVLALATAAYSLWRLDSTRDRLDRAGETIGQLQAAEATLRAELKSQASRERGAHRDINRRLDLLNETPKQLQELSATLEEFRGRAEGPERAWSRAEAAFLMELAQRRLNLDRDVETATVALESADMRLAALRDPSVTAVRQQLAKEIQALRAVRRPDTTGILARLTNAEEQAALAPVRGIVAVERSSPLSTLPEGLFARAWTVMTNAVTGLISVRKIDGRGGMVVTVEEQALRRQHLQLLLFSARAAVVRHDTASYRSSLAGARQWLGEFFDLSDATAVGLLNQIQALEPIDIDPPLPDVSGSSRALQSNVPARRVAQ
jgi:uroporphyrin-3 C-methyltransferase